MQSATAPGRSEGVLEKQAHRPTGRRRWDLTGWWRAARSGILGQPLRHALPEHIIPVQYRLPVLQCPSLLASGAGGVDWVSRTEFAAVSMG